MRSVALNALVAISGLAVASGTALTTLHPCPDCPKSLKVAPITVTEQLQKVWTCEAVTKTVKKKVFATPSCSTYEFLSTEVPCLGGASTTLVTKTDQMVELSHVSTVLTSYSYVPTACPVPKYGNGTAKYPTAQCTSTSTNYQTMVVDISAPYDECGPLALPPWEGSGLCTTCVSDDEKHQPVHVSKCLNGVCTTYAETWVSTKPTPASSTAETSYSSSAYCSESGINTIPVTATFTPTDSAGGYTAPVTSTFSITTSVAKPCTVDITKVITVTYTKEPAPSVQYSTSAAPVSTKTYCSNGAHTIPIVTTCTPTGPGFTEPVTTTVYYTTTVTDGPKTVSCTKTVTVTFTSTSTVCPVTVISGHTQSTAPPTVSATTTSGSSYSASSYSASSYSASSTGPSSTGASTTGASSYSASSYSVSSTGGPATGSGSTSCTTSSTSSTSSAPTAPPTVGQCDFYGCLGSTDGFPTFSILESSGSMDIEVCTSECQASGYTFAGLFTTDCYCAGEVGTASTDAANGVCDIPCPGDASETCGGYSAASRKRLATGGSGILLDVYECQTPTPTSSSSSSTSEPTSGPSSDPDPAPEKRGLDADMEISARTAREVKLRRGGLLRNPKVQQGPSVAKRDFGLKQPFGQ